MTAIENPAPENSIFDSHAHYDDERFDQDRDEILSALSKMGVCGVINCAVDPRSAEKILDICEKYPFCFAAVGYHPENLPERPPELSDIYPFFSNEKVVAIGEIGLDYFHGDDRENQKRWFSAQLCEAKKRSLPVIVHDRDAHEDTLNILKEHKPAGVVHCFSGSAETAREILSLGMFIGVGGVVTFKNARKIREALEVVPLSRILLETDAPYLAPEPYRGKTSHSGMIIRTAEKIAEIKSVSVDEVLKTSRENVARLFKIF